MAEEGSLTLAAYSEAATRTISDECRNDSNKCMINAVLGLGGEVGEVLDHIKKHMFHGHPLDLSHLEKEAGDILWYVNELCFALAATLDEVAHANIQKLKKRYPDGFSSERSLNRLDMVEVDSGPFLKLESMMGTETGRFKGGAGGSFSGTSHSSTDE